MSLGISTLTDDQLLELLQEACSELAARDPIIRSAAQQTIFDEAEKLNLARESVRLAVTKVRAEYEKRVRDEAAVEIQAAFDRGEIKLPGGEEVALIVDAEEKGRQAVVGNLVERVRRALQVPDEPMLMEMAREVYDRWQKTAKPSVAASPLSGLNFKQWEAMRKSQIEQDRILRQQQKYDVLFGNGAAWNSTAPAPAILTPDEKKIVDDVLTQAQATLKAQMDAITMAPSVPWVAPSLTDDDVKKAFDDVNAMPNRTKIDLRRPPRYVPYSWYVGSDDI